MAAKIGFFGKAIEIAGFITDADAKTFLLSDIAKAATKSGCFGEALEIADSITDADAKNFFLSKVNKKALVNKDFEAAEQELIQ